jgi:hypothetical protein
MVVGDDEDSAADPGARGGVGKVLGGRERMPPLALRRKVRELVDPEERGAWNVLVEIRLTSRLDSSEVVCAVDEAIDQ